MAVLSRAPLAVLLLGACSNKLVGLEDTPAPLARVRVEISGDRAPAGADLHVALVWAAEWLPEPFCVLPPASPAAEAVVAAGCPDTFGFVPRRVAAVAPIRPGEPATLELYSLPAAGDMVGDVTARIVHGSVILWDDVDGSGNLELRRAFFELEGDAGPGFPGPPPSVGTADVIYGASFVSMTAPDQRVTFREGDYLEATAFYPRVGCPAPPRGFSVASAGGFSAGAAVAAILQGKLPAQDPATCAVATLDQTSVHVAQQAPEDVQQVACLRRGASGVTRYREPDDDVGLQLADRKWACVPLPVLGDDPPSSTQQLVIAGAPADLCKQVRHYVLRGCEDDATCDMPGWDRTANPPAWWPCPTVP